MYIFIPTATFTEKGGWLSDTQFTETVGLPYLLAHGIAKPVADAYTDINIEADGEYKIYAYTYNWNAPWKPEYAPGIFNVKVGDYEHTFGDAGNEWGWQAGGSATLKRGTHRLTLSDLTGCEGRCAAIFITDEEDEPKSPTEYIECETDISGEFDYVVVGGGITGITAALCAARGGLKTALIQNRPVVGGNNSSEVRVWLSGKLCFDRFPKLGEVTKELEQETAAIMGSANRAENYEDDAKLGKLLSEKNVTLYMEHALTGAVCDGGNIKEVTLLDLNSCCYKKISAPLYADCTGDGTLGALCGADYEMTTSGHMELSNFWCVENAGHEVPFPACPWAMNLKDADFPGRIRAGGDDAEKEKASARYLGCWRWGAGYEHNPIEKAEYARDTNLRAMYGAWDAVKNVDGDYKNYRIAFSGHIAGKRESRRILGPLVITKNDLISRIEYPDAIIGIDWGLDLHTPNRNYYKSFVEGDAFLCSDGLERFETPYYLPYRCLYSRNVDNLFMAGRCVSVTHDALGPVRVMRTCGMMGEVVANAAIICNRYKITPDKVYTEKLDELKEVFI